MIIFFIKTSPIRLFLFNPHFLWLNSFPSMHIRGVLRLFLMGILHLIYPFVNLLQFQLHTPHLTHHGLHKHFRIILSRSIFGTALSTIVRHDCYKTKLEGKDLTILFLTCFHSRMWITLHSCFHSNKKKRKYVAFNPPTFSPLLPLFFYSIILFRSFETNQTTNWHRKTTFS